MAGKAPQSGASASGKRPAIQIDADFEEKPQAKRAAMKMALKRERGEGLPDTKSRIIFFSIIAIVLGVPVIVVTWLALIEPDSGDRYPKERADEARQVMRKIGERAIDVYRAGPAQFPPAPTPSSLNVPQAIVEGKYNIEYQLVYTPPSLTIIAPGIYGEAPNELILTVNLETGAMMYNR